MKSIFNNESGIFSKLELFTNLVLLNILWLIACLPVITIGAANAALYDVAYRLRRGDPEVFSPFWRAFRQNFKQATILMLPVCCLAMVLGVDYLYLLSSGRPIMVVMWVPVVVLSVICVAVCTYGFSMLARYEMKTGDVIRSSILCFFLNIPKSILMSLLAGLPLILLIAAPYLFMAGAILWLGFWFSFAAYINSWFLLAIFRKYSKDSTREETDQLVN